MTEQKIDLEVLIRRFIRQELRKLNPKDKDYTIEYLINEINTLIQCFDNDKDVLERLYHEYRLGTDILEILNNRSIYTFPIQGGKLFILRLDAPETPQDKLSGEKDKKTEWASTSETKPIRNVRKEYIKKAKLYIAIMEYKAWIEKNGLELPELKIKEVAPGIEDKKEAGSVSGEENNTLNPDQNSTVKTHPDNQTKEAGLISPVSSDTLNTNNNVIDTNPDDDKRKEIELVSLNNKIEKHLYYFSKNDEVNPDNYKNLVTLLTEYFLNEKTEYLSKPIESKNRMVRRLAYQLGELYKDVKGKNNIEAAYLMLCAKNIKIFQRFSSIEGSKLLHNYFTSNPKK